MACLKENMNFICVIEKHFKEYLCSNENGTYLPTKEYNALPQKQAKGIARHVLCFAKRDPPTGETFLRMVPNILEQQMVE